LHCVVDTSVWISLYKAGVLPEALRLTNKGWVFLVTDAVARELQEPSYDALAEQGVRYYPLLDEANSEVEALVQTELVLSEADASAVVAAQAVSALILTDDRPLREKAQKLRIQVHGTLWLLEQLVAARLIDDATLCLALERMMAAGRRLPTQVVSRLKTRYNCPPADSRPD
jgi:predicted nucleic acid-binding protein